MFVLFLQRQAVINMNHKVILSWVGGAIAAYISGTSGNHGVQAFFGILSGILLFLGLNYLVEKKNLIRTDTMNGWTDEKVRKFNEYQPKVVARRKKKEVLYDLNKQTIFRKGDVVRFAHADPAIKKEHEAVGKTFIIVKPSEMLNDDWIIREPEFAEIDGSGLSVRTSQLEFLGRPQKHTKKRTVNVVKKRHRSVWKLLVGDRVTILSTEPGSNRRLIGKKGMIEAQRTGSEYRHYVLGVWCKAKKIRNYTGAGRKIGSKFPNGYKKKS